MRKVFCLLALCASPLGAQAPSPALTFEELEQRAFPAPAILDLNESMARLRTQIDSSGRFALEGPTVEAELGPRRLEDGSTGADAGARIELPLIADGGRRDAASDQLGAALPDLMTAAAVEARLRLRRLYLDAWMAQESYDLRQRQIEALEEARTAVRERVRAGADAPYEEALVDGEILRVRSELDAARAAQGEAWAELRALAKLPDEPMRLAPPGAPRLAPPPDARARFESGVLMRSVTAGNTLDLAMLDFEQARRRSRWSLTGAVGREGDETFATAGAGYRFPRRGESANLAAERAAAGTARARRAESEVDRLVTRFEVLRERAERFGPIVPPDSFDEALRALAARFALGKERPSEILPVRRQLLEAREAALARIREAHALAAELEALTSGGAQ